MLKIAVGLTAGAILGVHVLTTRRLKIPPESLLAQDSSQCINDFPAHSCLSDLFEVKIPRRLVGSLTVNQFARAFGHSPVFSLERVFFKQIGVCEDIQVPKAFEVGERLMLLVVAKRNKDEILAKWHAPPGSRFSELSGGTYFRVIDEESASSVTVQFGSSLKAPIEAPVSDIAVRYHLFYSRVLILNTVVTVVARKVLGIL
ncbi:hypothetical protein BC830DRAFT_305664 [Chytriomyces sp. MP71]|nr:hypothetical protein BC830DRAFT_305664 [Chytriomyces sp. MP71]